VKPSVKYLIIFHRRNKYPISLMCEFFRVSRSGYYNFLNRIDKPSRDEPIAQMIAECQGHCNKTYGCRRIKIWLEKVKHKHFNLKTLLRIMRKYDLLAEIRRRRKYRQMGEQLHKYENLLNRQFQADHPNKKWVTDISYIHTDQGVLYLSVISDLFDNSIVSYQTGTEQTVNLVLNTIKAALQKEAVTVELQLHSDQGFQYTSIGYHTLTKEYGITPSMSRRGNCYDNAPVENFFGILKTECIYRVKLKTLNEARQAVAEYIWFYNNERVQLKTKLTPLEKRRQIA
jgi:putative transposase